MVYEFYGKPDNNLQVEVVDEDVSIRAARDNWSKEHRDRFIRYLADEGFIPDNHRWMVNSDFLGPQWEIDHRWLVVNEPLRRRSELLVISTILLSGGFLGIIFVFLT